ncbi:MAG TPA: UDP binding domain-containing protein, partial [Verrucomicrobiae bacterium]|nr:UDP binding domain-containing protein [Verrucomicrobiae bacterium]
GTGVGGHCIPCDPHYLLWAARAARVSTPLIEQAMNDIAVRPTRIVDQIVATLSSVGHGIRGARILVVGAAYKRGVEDVRESPALEIMAELIDREAIVEYVDSLVPALRLRDGTVLQSTVEPAAQYDAAVLHVLQPGFDPAWLDACRVVVDPGGLVRRHGLTHSVSNMSRRRG